MSQNVAEIEAQLARIRESPELLLRYDVTGDGELDEREWELVRRMLALELRTAAERQTQWSLDVEPKVLQERFEVVGLLGRGGQAFTYLARDQQNDGAHVVVKELAIKVAADWKSVELFEREAAVLERLTHLNIPRYVDAFHLQDEGDGVRFMLVQDFVDGEDLGHFVARGGRWSPVEAVRRMAEVCDILDYLHHKSPAVIHRDIKPSNLIVGRDGALYLVDFGAVQMVVPNTVGGSTIIGTSGYVPMEQYMGHAEPASDLYALGATAVHMICGVHPADLPFKRSRLQFAEHVNASDDLIELLTAMLDPNVEDRPESAAWLAQRLRELRGEPEPVAEVVSTTFRISSDPSGARVSHRSRLVPGATPLSLTLRDDELPATITVTAPKHHPRDVTIESTTPEVVSVELDPLPKQEKPRSPLSPPSPPSALQPSTPDEVPAVRPSQPPGVAVQRSTVATVVTASSKTGFLLMIAALLVLLLMSAYGVMAGAAFNPSLAFIGIGIAIVPFVLAAVRLPSELEMNANGWSMRGRAEWQRLSAHGRPRLFGAAVSGTIDEIVSVEVVGNTLQIQTVDGDIAEMALPGSVSSPEHRAWIEETVRGDLERYRALREVDGG